MSKAAAPCTSSTSAGDALVRAIERGDGDALARAMHNGKVKLRPKE
jgi:hypothetical protein